MPNLLKAPLKAIEATNKSLRRQDFPSSMKKLIDKYGSQPILLVPFKWNL